MTRTTKTFPRDVFQSAVTNAEIDPDNIREDYSGRGMYGEMCLGVTHESPADLLRLFANLGEMTGTDGFTLQDKVWQLAGAARSDNMGYDTITYFPGWKLDGEPDGDDDE